MRGILPTPRYEDRLRPLETADHVFMPYKIRRTLVMPMLDENPETNPHTVQGKVLRCDVNGAMSVSPRPWGYANESFEYFLIRCDPVISLAVLTSDRDVKYAYWTAGINVLRLEWCLSDGSVIMDLPQDEGMVVMPGVSDRFWVRAVGPLGAPVVLNIYQYERRYQYG